MTTKQKWTWKINQHCYFCQREEWDNPNIPLRKNPLLGCDTILSKKDGKLVAVLICEGCYNKEVKK